MIDMFETKNWWDNFPELEQDLEENIA